MSTLANEKNPKKRKGIQHWQIVTLYLVIYDVAVIALSYSVALWLRFDCRFRSIPQEYLGAYLKFIPIYIVFCLFVFWKLRLYKSIWRFASYSELIRLTMATSSSIMIFGTLPSSS